MDLKSNLIYSFLLIFGFLTVKIQAKIFFIIIRNISLTDSYIHSKYDIIFPISVYRILRKYLFAPFIVLLLAVYSYLSILQFKSTSSFEQLKLLWIFFNGFSFCFAFYQILRALECIIILPSFEQIKDKHNIVYIKSVLFFMVKFMTILFGFTYFNSSFLFKFNRNLYLIIQFIATIIFLSYIEVFRSFSASSQLILDKHLTLGDEIEIRNICGKVVSLHVKLICLEKKGGGIISIPPSDFLTYPYVNYSSPKFQKKLFVNIISPLDLQEINHLKVQLTQFLYNKFNENETFVTFLAKSTITESRISTSISASLSGLHTFYAPNQTFYDVFEISWMESLQHGPNEITLAIMSFFEDKKVEIAE